jgi:signal transduction histidine kinase
MNDVVTAILWAAIAATLAWFATWPLRRRSISALLLSLTLTCTAASAGAMLGAVHSMLVPMGHETAVLVVSVAAGLLTAVAAVAAARRLSKEHAVLRAAVADLASGAPAQQGGPRLSIELERVRQQLQSTVTELGDSRAREQALERSRRELVAWMSHDLRTPLAGLRAMAEALEDGVPDDPSTYYKQIGAAVTRLDSMVDDLFDLSRIQSGSLGPLSERVSVDDVVDEVVTTLMPLATARDVVLTGHRSTSGAVVRGDHAILNRALTNLVANAVRHTSDGGNVNIRVCTDSAPVTVDVDDQCGGIAVDVLPRVFDLGFRGTPARPSGARSGGAGLGLAITRGIIEAHGGQVSVANTERGCRFRVVLPRG